MRLVLFQIIGTREKLYQHHTRYKSSDVSPKSHSANIAAEGGQTANKLDK
jgi:hypothetical protein